MGEMALVSFTTGGCACNADLALRDAPIVILGRRKPLAGGSCTHKEIRMETGESDRNADALSGDQPEQPAQAPRVRVGPLATLIAGLALGLLIGYVGRPLVEPIPMVRPIALATGVAGPATATPVDMATVIAQTRHFTGDVNAPVTIIEFGDFQ
jgi:hypothetical protein